MGVFLFFVLLNTGSDTEACTYYSFLFAPALLSAVYSLIAVFRTEIIAVESNKGCDI